MELEGGFSRGLEGGLEKGLQGGLEKGGLLILEGASSPFSSPLEKGGRLRGASRGLDKRELEKEA